MIQAAVRGAAAEETGRGCRHQFRASDATSPVLVAALAAYGNWRLALGVVGVAGLTVALVLYVNRHLLVYAQTSSARPAEAGQRRLAYLRMVGSPVVLMAFAYFAMTAFAGS